MYRKRLQQHRDFLREKLVIPKDGPVYYKRISFLPHVWQRLDRTKWEIERIETEMVEMGLRYAFQVVQAIAATISSERERS